VGSESEEVPVNDTMTAAVLLRPVPPPAAAVPGGGPARRDAAVRLGATAVLWLSLLAVAYWWAAGAGIQGPAGWLTWPTSLGRLTGLAATSKTSRWWCWRASSALTVGQHDHIHEVLERLQRIEAAVTHGQGSGPAR
jgi:hypothetical protein